MSHFFLITFGPNGKDNAVQQLNKGKSIVMFANSLHLSLIIEANDAPFDHFSFNLVCAVIDFVCWLPRLSIPHG